MNGDDAFWNFFSTVIFFIPFQLNISLFSLRVRFRVWILSSFNHLSCRKKSEYDKKKSCGSLQNHKRQGYEFRDEEDGGGGSTCTSLWATWLQDRDWIDRFKHKLVISNNIYFAGLIVSESHYSAIVPYHTVTKIIIKLQNLRVNERETDWSPSLPYQQTAMSKGRDAERLSVCSGQLSAVDVRPSLFFVVGQLF